jgi:hypothetical protein
MTMLLLEGFSKYENIFDARRFQGFDHASGFVLNTHPITGSYWFGNISNGDWHVQVPWGDTFTIGFSFIVTEEDMGGAATDIIQTYGQQTDFDGVENLVLSITEGGDLRVHRSSTLLATTAGLGILPDRWYYIEWNFLIHDSAGTLDIQVDGVNVLSETSQDTNNGCLNNAINKFVFKASVALDLGYADVYINDDAGSKNTGFIGPIHVETILPDGDGDRTDFTQLSGLTNYEMVDDGALPDDDTTYNSSSTAGHDDLFTFGALVTPADTVPGVQVVAYARKEDAGHRTLRALARSSVSELTGVSNTLHSDRYRYVAGIIELNPDGAIDWTTTTVDAAEFGYELDV